MNKLKPEDIELLREIIATPLEQLINEHKAYCEFQDWQWEDSLKIMITDYKKWANKSIGKTPRKLYLEIIKNLEQEATADVKCQNHTNRRGALDYRIGRNKQENRNTGDTDNLASKIIPQPFRVKKERLYRLGRKTE